MLYLSLGFTPYLNLFSPTRRAVKGVSRHPFSTVRNIKSASFPATIVAPTCVFYLLTGLYIRAIHRMALIPAPRVGGSAFEKRWTRWARTTFPPIPPDFLFNIILCTDVKRHPWRSTSWRRHRVGADKC